MTTRNRFPVAVWTALLAVLTAGRAPRRVRGWVAWRLWRSLPVKKAAR